jgi:hypothetical protein
MSAFLVDELLALLDAKIKYLNTVIKVLTSEQQGTPLAPCQPISNASSIELEDVVKIASQVW